MAVLNPGPLDLAKLPFQPLKGPSGFLTYDPTPEISLPHDQSSPPSSKPRFQPDSPRWAGSSRPVTQQLASWYSEVEAAGSRTASVEKQNLIARIMRHMSRGRITGLGQSAVNSCYYTNTTYKPFQIVPDSESQIQVTVCPANWCV